MTTQPWQEEKLENSWVEHIVDRIYKSVGEGTFHKSDNEGGLYANRTGFIRYITFMKDKERADERAKTIKECAEINRKEKVIEVGVDTISLRYKEWLNHRLERSAKAIENLK